MSAVVAVAGMTQDQGTTSVAAMDKEDMVVAGMEAMASRAETAMVKEDMEEMVVATEAGTPEEGMVVAAVEGDIRHDEMRWI